MYLSEDWFYTHPSLKTPTSVTHEFLKSGRQMTNNSKKRSHKQINFNSHYNKKLNLEESEQISKQKLLEKLYNTSTYSREFYAPYPLVCLAKASIVDNIDPLFNRRPVNVFHMSPSASGKFMDDHFLQPSEARKKINFFRQIRQMSFIDQINI